jgi:hypothetical protein
LVIVLLFLQQAASLLFLRQDVERRDADDRAFDRVAELIGAEDDVERLIPRHFAQRHIDGALHARIDHHVQPGDLREGAQHGAQVDALEVEADRTAREVTVARARRRRTHRLHGLGRGH